MLLGAITLTVILAFRQPDVFKVTRTIEVKAKPGVIFPHINNLELGQKWSPWVEMEPDAQYKFEGAKSGEGAILHWEGKKTGKGTMTIVESKPSEYVRSRLDFYKPMQSISTAEIALAPKGEQTQITWSMEGKNNFLAKVVNVLMDCETMVGSQFEKGLSNLKAIVEKE